MALARRLPFAPGGDGSFTSFLAPPAGRKPRPRQGHEIEAPPKTLKAFWFPFEAEKCK